MMGSVFSDSELSTVSITEGNWSYAGLQHCDFSGHSLNDINFQCADLRFADFAKARVKNCDFTDCMLSNASFYNADIRDNVFNNIDLQTTNIKGAKIDLQLAVTIANMLGAKCLY